MPGPRAWASQTQRLAVLFVLVTALTACAQAPFFNADGESQAAVVPHASDFGADLLPRRGEILPTSSLPATADASSAEVPVPTPRGSRAEVKGNGKAGKIGPRSGEILPATAFVPAPAPAVAPTSITSATVSTEVAAAEAPLPVAATPTVPVAQVPLAPPAPLPDLPPQVTEAKAAPVPAPSVVAMTAQTRVPETGDQPLMQLGPGDAVILTVFGRPEFNTTTYVSDKGEIAVPLAGNVQVAGLSPADAGRRVGEALKRGQFLVNPQVSIALANFRSQQVSVLGEVKAPGRFPIESKTSVFDLLAQAGGVLETGSDTVYLLRPNAEGQVERYPFNLRGLTAGNDASIREVSLRGGDSIYVPQAEHFYVYGEVTQPNRYRLEPGTTVVQAISRSGGLTPRGSERRIEIKRRDRDGNYKTIDAKLTDPVLPDDVIRVKERIF